MPSVQTQLKELRLKVEALQVEVAGRQNISSMIVWDGQNESSVNQKTSRMQEEFSGLIVHLTPEPSPLAVTRISASGVNEPDTLSQNDFEALKREIVRSLDSPSAQNDPAAD